eukprot:CAMPEP_0117497862 /NCGR_PEP_ID=MMETSP0784-20121206/21407_1 /TAXON_ID=39447 /ORGANISM="" /LENGTH=350 /DNA_ID=CAMNT_0005292909 /DNA_START=24 /DNA_END=1076 /DNA_ORIENTATION=+
MASSGHSSRTNEHRASEAEACFSSLIAANKSSGVPTDMPVVFLSHGAGPCFFIEGFWKSSSDPGIGIGSPTAKFLASLGDALPRPAAILCISAHYESYHHIKVGSNPSPSMIYDYNGWPDHTYELQYPAPGDPVLASQVAKLLRDGGVPCEEDPQNGFDHGVFVPLLLMYADASIPVVPLSIHCSYAGEFHFRIGELLQPLRRQGVLILGSGAASHTCSIRSLRPRWHDYLTDTLCAVPAGDRRRRLTTYRKETLCRMAHPRPDHLMPALVAAGAAGRLPGYKVHARVARLDTSSFVFSPAIVAAKGREPSRQNESSLFEPVAATAPLEAEDLGTAAVEPAEARGMCRLI